MCGRVVASPPANGIIEECDFGPLVREVANPKVVLRVLRKAPEVAGQQSIEASGEPAVQVQLSDES